MNKVNELVLCRQNYDSQEVFEDEIKKAVMVLLNANQIMTIRYDEPGFSSWEYGIRYAECLCADGILPALYTVYGNDRNNQERDGKLLKDIIAEQGIDGFLQVENNVNKSIQTEKTVIATGGSVVYGEEAMEHLKEIATIVYLSCPYDRLTRRLGDLKGRGVVLREGQTLRTIYEERCALYEKYADITVDEGMYDIEQTLEILLSVLREAKIEK